MTSARRSCRLAVAAAVALVAMGCRSLPAPGWEEQVAGSVDVAIVTAREDAPRLRLDASEAFVFPNLIEPVAMPSYPEALLPLRLAPVQLCVELDVSADGAVSMARRRIDAACPMDAGTHEPAFAEALLAAVRQWTYDPALVCRTPDGRAVAHACSEPDAVDTPTAVRLSYRFTFSQQDGRPRVDMAGGAGGGER